MMRLGWSVGLLAMSVGTLCLHAQDHAALDNVILSEDAFDQSIMMEESVELPPTDDWFSLSVPQLITWDGSVELGINGSGGNAESLSVMTGADLKRETEENIWTIDFIYTKTSSRSITTQHNALFRSEYKKLLPGSPWSLFLRFGGEYDEFKAFDVRLAMNAGVGYDFIKNDITTLAGRFGAGGSREIGGPTNALNPEAVFGMDYECQITKRQKLNATIDYFPAWNDFTDYRVVSVAEWELLLDKEANLSLNLKVVDRYDSTPHGLRPNDLTYAALLLWKL